MTTLHLTLKKKWFDLILSGEKKEEYREIKPYWIRRLVKNADYPEVAQKPHFIDGYGQEYCITEYRPFTHITFSNGYAKNAPQFTIECKGIKVGKGKSEWGAPNEQVFIISLGKILERKNIPNDTSHS